MGFKNTGSHGGGGEGQEVKESYRRRALDMIKSFENSQNPILIIFPSLRSGVLFFAAAKEKGS